MCSPPSPTRTAHTPCPPRHARHAHRLPAQSLFLWRECAVLGPPCSAALLPPHRAARPPCHSRCCVRLSQPQLRRDLRPSFRAFGRPRANGLQIVCKLFANFVSSIEHSACLCGPSNCSQTICPQAGARSSACSTYYLRTLFATADPDRQMLLQRLQIICAYYLPRSSAFFALTLLHIVCSNSLPNLLMSIIFAQIIWARLPPPPRLQII